MNDRDLLLSFIGSITLADHMGDVADCITTVLKRLDMEIKWNDLNELSKELHKRGVTTLYGTRLVSEGS